MTSEKTGLLTKQTAGDPFSVYASAMKARTFDGELLKFSKGDYFAGLDDKPIPIGTRLVAIMDRLKIGFIHWTNNAPGDHIMGFVADNFTPPRRSELGDLDKTLWDTDNNGVPRDPWQFTNHLPFASPNDHSSIYTFATASRGGLNAIGELCWEHGRNNRPGCFPVVSLQVDSYLHREKTYGRIKVPVLKIVGYVEKAPYVALLDHAPKGADEPEQVALSSKPKPQYAAKYDPPAPADNAFAGFDPDDEINF